MASFTRRRLYFVALAIHLTAFIVVPSDDIKFSNWQLLSPDYSAETHGLSKKGVRCRDIACLRNALQSIHFHDVPVYDTNTAALISICDHGPKEFNTELREMPIDGTHPAFWRCSDAYLHTFFVDQTIVQIPLTSKSCTLTRIMHKAGTWAEIQYLNGALVVSVKSSSPWESKIFEISQSIKVGQRFTQNIVISASKSDFYVNQQLVLSLEMPDSEFYFQTGASSHCVADVDSDRSIVWIHDLSVSHAPVQSYHNDIITEGAVLETLTAADFIADALSNSSSSPSYFPTLMPTPLPSSQPTIAPNADPTSQPSTQPTAEPTTQPTSQPTSLPTGLSTSCPSSQPSSSPSSQPTCQPSANNDIINAAPRTQKSTYRAAVNPAAIGAIFLGCAGCLMIATVAAIVVVGKRRRRREEIRNRALSAGMLGSIDRAMNLSYSSYHGLMLYENKGQGQGSGSSSRSSRRNSHGGGDSPNGGFYGADHNHITGFRDSYNGNDNTTNGHTITLPQQSTNELGATNNTVRSPIIDQSLERSNSRV